MNVYLLKDFNDININVLNNAISLLPEQRRLYNDTLKTSEGKLFNALSFYLLKYVFNKEKSIVIDNNIDFIFGEKNKPYLENIKIDFSISHSKAGIVCAVYDGRDTVGVDIEKIGTYNEKIALRVCCKKELFLLSNEPDNKKANLFYEMWVKKEAYSKMTGKGFSEGFNNINTLQHIYKNARLFSVMDFDFFIGISVTGNVNGINTIKVNIEDII